MGMHRYAVRHLLGWLLCALSRHDWRNKYSVDGTHWERKPVVVAPILVQRCERCWKTRFLG